MVFEILSLICTGGDPGIPLGDPRSVSLNASYHKEQLYGLGVRF